MRMRVYLTVINAELYFLWIHLMVPILVYHLVYRKVYQRKTSSCSYQIRLHFRLSQVQTFFVYSVVAQQVVSLSRRPRSAGSGVVPGSRGACRHAGRWRSGISFHNCRVSFRQVRRRAGSQGKKRPPQRGGRIRSEIRHAFRSCAFSRRLSRGCTWSSAVR